MYIYIYIGTVTYINKHVVPKEKIHLAFKINE